MGDDQIQKRMQILPRLAQLIDAPAITAGRIENGEIQLLIAGIERNEEIKDFIHHLIGAGVAAIDLVDDDDGAEPWASALPRTNLVWGIGPSAASVSRITPSAM